MNKFLNILIISNYFQSRSGNTREVSTEIKMLEARLRETYFNFDVILRIGIKRNLFICNFSSVIFELMKDDFKPEKISSSSMFGLF